MRNRRSVSLIVMLALAVAALVGTFVAGNEPQLGLDLQGGASVVLKPPKGTPKGTINQAIEIIRSRVDALGVSEPEISRQGNAVVVELPGVKNQQKALKIVGTTAELRFRPVLNTIPAEKKPPATTTSTSTTAEATAEPTSTTTTTTPAAQIPSTPRSQNKANAQVILPDKDGKVRHVLGPAGSIGKDISSARAQVSPTGQWTVGLTMTKSGITPFNEVAGRCFARDATCPTGQLAVELDGIVQSA